MGAVPVPGGFEDGFDGGVLDAPVEFGLGFAGVGVEGGRVAGAAGFFDGGDFLAGDFFGGVDDFADGGGGAGAEVVEEGLAGLFEFFEYGDVGAAEVVDVDVVAEAGAVGGRVIGAEDFDVFAFAEGDVEDEGNEVGFGGMVFADLAVGGGSGGVEIAEGGGAEAVGGGEGF